MPRVLGLTALALATTGAVYAGPASSATPELVDDAALLATVSRPAAQPAERAEVARTAPEVLFEREVRISRDTSRRPLKDARRNDRSASSEAKARQKKAALAKAAAASRAEREAAEAARNAWQLPLERGVYHLSAEFGQCSALWSQCHTGLDFAAPSGTPIRAVASGVVTETAYAGAYGNRTILKLHDGTEIWYCHQTSFAAQPGQSVVAGETIGYVGSTGNSTGSHLHLEVRPGGGDPVDPYQALAGHGQQP